jgi:SAM-dependent methyltransferase
MFGNSDRGRRRAGSGDSRQQRLHEGGGPAGHLFRSGNGDVIAGSRGFRGGRGDLFSYDPDERFDLVFDSGCLHSLVGGNVVAYRQQVLRWLAPGGDYVLDHWGKRNALDWWPIGPRRRSQHAIERLFAPDLRLVETEVVELPVPMPFGGRVRAVGYWFQRTDGK